MTEAQGNDLIAKVADLVEQLKAVGQLAAWQHFWLESLWWVMFALLLVLVFHAVRGLDRGS